MLRDSLVYRLFSAEDWTSAKEMDTLPYAAVDERDGFFHLSTASQVMETARLHYGDHPVLVAAGISPGGLGEKLRYEPSRGGELFPHYFGFLPTDQVIDHVTLRRTPSGHFVLEASE